MLPRFKRFVGWGFQGTWKPFPTHSHVYTQQKNVERESKLENSNHFIIN